MTIESLQDKQKKRERSLVRHVIFPTWEEVVEFKNNSGLPINVAEQRIQPAQIADELYRESMLIMVELYQAKRPNSSPHQAFQWMEASFLEHLVSQLDLGKSRRGAPVVTKGLHLKLSDLLNAHGVKPEVLNKALLYIVLHQVIECALGGFEAEDEEEIDEVEDEVPQVEALTNQNVPDGSIPIDISRTALCGRIWQLIGLEVNARLARSGVGEYRTAGLRQQRLGTDRTLRQFESTAGIERLTGMKYAATLLHILSAFTDQNLFKFQSINIGKSSAVKTVYRLVVLQPLVEYLKSRRITAPIVPLNAPMLVKPLRWQTDRGTSQGGYLTRYLPYFKMAVKNERLRQVIRATNGRTITDEPGQRESCAALREPFVAANLCQETAWRINQDVYGVVKTLLAWRDGCRKTPRPLVQGADKVLPAMSPFKSKLDAEAIVAVPEEWRGWLLSEAFETQTRQGLKIGKGPGGRIGSPFSKMILEDCAELEEFYFPYQADFRGRLYAVAGILSPMGDDLSRGLLEFANGKALGTSEAATMLAYHGADLVPVETIAKHFSVQRNELCLSHRQQWITDYSEQIKLSAQAPITNIWWRDIAPSNPFKFLAFCFAWTRYLEKGLAAFLYLPVHVDGTCNGLQHIAVLSKDIKLARSTNVVPTAMADGSITIKDIYNEVGAAVVREIADSDSSQSKSRLKSRDGVGEGLLLFLMKHVAILINRKVSKSIVMILPYGAGRSTFVDKCLPELVNSCLVSATASTLSGTNMPWLREEMEADLLAALPLLGEMVRVNRATTYAFLRKEFRPMAAFVAQTYEAVINASFPAMKAFKKRLSGIAKPVIEKNVPLLWISPTGVPVVQPGFISERKIVDIKVSGSRLKPTLSFMTEDVDKVGQGKGVLPNFIHSLDSAHLHKTLIATDEAVFSMLPDETARAQHKPAYSVLHDSFGTHAADAPALARCLREQFVALYSDPTVGLEYLEKWFALLTSPRRQLAQRLLKTGNESITVDLDAKNLLRLQLVKLVNNWHFQNRENEVRTNLEIDAGKIQANETNLVVEQITSIVFAEQNEGTRGALDKEEVIKLAQYLIDIKDQGWEPPPWLHEVKKSPCFFC